MIAWVDGSAGASGDMLLGALVDVGVPIEVPQSEIDRLEVGVTLRAEGVTRASIGAHQVHVDVPDAGVRHRHLPEIVELLGALDAGVRGHAIAVFERLADAEATVHRVDRDAVHFHEVGALDSIADIVGVCAGFEFLRREHGMTELHCSTLSLGNGQARSTHGPIPVPVPAVVALLSGVAPVTSGPAPFEATTPTGAALLAHWVDVWGPMPTMTMSGSGSGAGGRDLVEVCNAVRIVIGSPVTG